MENLSLGEFRALVAKAFRGAGYSWGLTEEAAFASGQLAENGIDAGATVVRLLTATDGTPGALLMPTASSGQLEASRRWGSAGAVLCPVCVGTSILDLGRFSGVASGSERELEALIEPVFVAPFLSVVLESHAEPPAGYVIEWEGGRCEVGAHGFVLHGSALNGGDTVTVTESTDLTIRESPPTLRVELDAKTAAALEAFAHRTYAPATSASRTSGAGPA